MRQHKISSKFFIISLLAITAFSITGCQLNRSSSEFEQVFGARYLPERFYALGGVGYELNGQKRIRYVGAYEVEENGRLGLVWADYTRDRMGDWYRQNFMETPFAFAESPEEANRIAKDYLAKAPFTGSWADE